MQGIYLLRKRESPLSIWHLLQSNYQQIKNTQIFLIIRLSTLNRYLTNEYTIAVVLKSVDCFPGQHDVFDADKPDKSHNMSQGLHIIHSVYDEYLLFHHRLCRLSGKIMWLKLILKAFNYFSRNNRLLTWQIEWLSIKQFLPLSWFEQVSFPGFFDLDIYHSNCPEYDSKLHSRYICWYQNDEQANAFVHHSDIHDIWMLWSFTQYNIKCLCVNSF